jgi:hypothetical protein
MRKVFIVLSAVTLLAGHLNAAEALKITNPADKQIVESYLKHVNTFRRMVTPEYCRKTAAGQVTNYTWAVMPVLDTSLTAYRVTGEAKYLEIFVGMFANCRSAMTKGSDGYLGWYGKTLPLMQDPKDPDKKVDEILNSFAAADVLSRFIEETDKDKAQKAKYAKQRTAYLDLLENHLIPKWDARGCFVDLGARGGVYRGPTGMSPTRSRLTKPHNMHEIIIGGLLSLYRVTGKDAYMARAVKLGTRFKRCLTLKDGHYEWNYWDPAGAWDVHPSDKGKWKHWIGVEHKGSYYSLSLTQAVALYHHGVVFDRKDIDRFLKTQMATCWNGDAENPKWARVDGSTSNKYMVGSYLCPALAPFNQKLADFIYTGKRRQKRVDGAGHTWSGGVQARGWIVGKYLNLPAAKGGQAMYPQAEVSFLKKEANRRLMKSLAFTVTAPGYSSPKTPDEMKDMPPEPK